MKSILVIDDEGPVREVLKLALGDRGYRVYEAEDGRRGVEVFTDHKPDIVITDVNMPEMTGIEVTQDIKKLDTGADVVIMTGFGSEDLLIEALRAGASNYIKKPIVFKELFTILDGIYLKKSIKKRYEVLKDNLVEEQKIIAIDNDVTKVWGTVNQVLFNLPPRLQDRHVEGAKLGLYEVIVNAIEHGNLGITYEEKEKTLNDGSYHSLLQERLGRANEQGKKVFIQSTLNGSGVTIEVRDEGIGFDFTKLAPMLDTEGIMSAHGRGILLASLYYDRVEYVDPGNKVILRKAFSF
jgi:CheY-like chemotaxis protein